MSAEHILYLMECAHAVQSKDLVTSNTGHGHLPPLPINTLCEEPSA